MKTINIRVSDKAAEKFLSMNEQEKDRFSRLVNELLEDKRTLLQVMDDMSLQAKRKGLTPEILEELLKDE
jgi:predicted CopG family antitoxin